MTNSLKEHFPMIRDRKELEELIQNNEQLKTTFESWNKERQKEFLDFCTGVRGTKVLYDSFFKEVMNPEYAPERLENFLSVLLRRRIRIVQILPNDSTRIADEASLLITDIMVELEDGSYANVEIQKIGYTFPGERCACYSADMLLRQYKRTRSKYEKNFSYRQIKNVYLIVIYENSPREFKAFPHKYCHHSRQVFDTGLPLNLLQEFIMIPLDIYHNTMQNRPIETPLEAWLTFLGSDEPDRIIQLITSYPEFKPMYETLYQMCWNVEAVMGFFSEELRILDRNTVKYMIEEQQKEIDSLKEANEDQAVQLEKKDALLEKKDAELEKQAVQLEEKEDTLEKMAAEIEALKRKLEVYQNQ